ncbi:MAG TPA: hypothetical protein VI670_26875 [Thermoanaerobaculia bacterium]|jgi:hypothetical protein
MTRSIKSLSRDELAAYVADNLANCFEEEALAILENRYVTPQICQQIARSQRLTAFYSVRLRLVALRQTPQAHAVKLIHYLYWFDLLRLSVDVKVPPPVRRAIDQLLLTNVNKLTVGQRVSSARRCNGTLAKALMFDPELSVFEALLTNPRLREEDLVALASSPRATPEQLRLLSDDRKWSYRYAIRKALVLNPLTPRAAAASQLRHLRRTDLRAIHGNPSTSTYLRRCIERLLPS